MHKKYPLQITISTLFIVITIVLGSILSWQSFIKTSDIMLDSADDLYERISQELSLDFKATYGPVAGGLRQFRLSPVINAKTFAQRVSHLPAFLAVLDSESSVFGVGIGYESGDYFGITSVSTDYVSKNYSLPDGAAYLVLYVKRDKSEAEFEAGKLYTVFYDKALNELFRNSGTATKFDSRLRPWYQQATDIPRATKPYVFYRSKIVGLAAMSKTAVPGAIVVFDITLENLSKTILKYQVTPGSEVVLINAEARVFAYKHQHKVIIENAGYSQEGESDATIKLANLTQLNSSVLEYVSNNIEIKEGKLSFEYDSQQWVGSARVVAKPGGVDLYALMLSPVDELLADAIAIRWHLVQIGIIVVIIFIPLIWFVSKRISTPLNVLSQEANAISRFNFDETKSQSSFIREVDELDSAMEMMKSTINKFIRLISSLASEPDLDALLKSITQETMSISKSDAALIYLMDEKDDLLKAEFLCDKQKTLPLGNEYPALSLQDAAALLGDSGNYKSHVVELNKDGSGKLVALLESLGVEKLTSIILPLQNRNDDLIGLLCLAFKSGDAEIHASNIAFVEALSGFAAVTLESRQSLHMQEALLQAFIKLIAGAIDAKSPYTGGHCSRVPEITLMLAKAACESNSGIFSQFDLSEKQWEELSIAGWLHDCGKVTTPEYVVDKATKLETIYDRIHEVRMRFEVLKRDAEIDCWQQIADGGNREKLLTDLELIKSEIDADFAFVAECNVGGEYMAEDKIERLKVIAARTWSRTLDDSLGLSWEELNRKQGGDVDFPVEENLISDKPEHLIARHKNDKIPAENPWGFNIETPEYKYNRGELYNLSVQRGTLSDEERYMINGHMIQTIMMLDNLPFPKHLRDVSLIAGSHHETMDGKGYPKKLIMAEQPLTARMMVIADIFEALTASDRPYKKAKTLSESLRILSFMRNDKHIDDDLFELFLCSGVYLDYAEKFLLPEQIDSVNINDYLS